MTTREILRVTQANILEGCGLTGLDMEDALERLEDEWNEIMKIASEQELVDEKEKRKKIIHRKINEVLSYVDFKLTQTSTESEIKDKAHEIAGYQEISSLVKREDKKIYLEWYVSLLIIIVLNKKLA